MSASGETSADLGLGNSRTTSSMPEPSVVLDTTLRDGEQAPGVALTPSEKAEYVRLAEEAGIRYIEVGFPQNPLDLDACVAAARAARQARIVAMALTTRESVTLVSDIGAHEVLFVVPSSHDHLSGVFGRPYPALRDCLLDSIEVAHALGLAVNVGLEDASEGDLDMIFRLLDDLAPVADRVGCVTVPDTRGQLLPGETITLLSAIRGHLPHADCRLAFHAHNDLGLATANTLAALQMRPAVDCVHVTSCGFGERAGNASLEQIAVILALKLHRPTGIRLDHLLSLCQYTEAVFSTSAGVHAPVIGEKVFSHESGLHQRALLKNSRSYQFLNPEHFGRQVRLVLGKHSGRDFREYVALMAGCSEAEVASLQQRFVNGIRPVRAGSRNEKGDSPDEQIRVGLGVDDIVHLIKMSRSGEQLSGEGSFGQD